MSRTPCAPEVLTRPLAPARPQIEENSAFVMSKRTHADFSPRDVDKAVCLQRRVLALRACALLMCARAQRAWSEELRKQSPLDKFIESWKQVEEQRRDATSSAAVRY